MEVGTIREYLTGEEMSFVGVREKKGFVSKENAGVGLDRIWLVASPPILGWLGLKSCDSARIHADFNFVLYG